MAEIIRRTVSIDMRNKCYTDVIVGYLYVSYIDKKGKLQYKKNPVIHTMNFINYN